jgi:hypothetical protein
VQKRVFTVIEAAAILKSLLCGAVAVFQSKL